MDSENIIKIENGMTYPKGAADCKRLTAYGVGVFKNYKLVAVEPRPDNGVCNADRVQEQLGKIVAQSSGHRTGVQKKKLVDEVINKTVAKADLPPEEQKVVEKINPNVKAKADKPDDDKQPEKKADVPAWVSADEPDDDVTADEMIEWAEASGVELSSTDKRSKGKILNAIKTQLVED